MRHTRHLLLAGVVVLAMVTGTFAQTQTPSVPLIDRQLFFGNPEISSATLSPDGRYIAFRKPWDGTLNIWVKKAEEPFDNAKRITGIEEVTVPAGTFKAWKVELASAGGKPGTQTLWIDVKSRRVVKTSGALANGALVSAELMK